MVLSNPTTWQRLREKAGMPVRVYIKRLTSAEPHNLMLRDAEKRPVFISENTKRGICMDHQLKGDSTDRLTIEDGRAFREVTI